MNRIFISRAINADSPLHLIIGDQDILISRSLIQFKPIEFSAPSADWIFFYSRNGVKYFFENSNLALYPYLWACMSHGTADELSHYVTDISFVGNGSPEEVAQSFKNTLERDASTCYIRAKYSMDSVRTLINREQDFSIPVYHNSMSENIPNEKFDVLIFTSPMNVDAWFAKRTYQGEKIIAIGKTTARRLAEQEISNVIIAEQPSEKGISESLREVLN